MIFIDYNDKRPIYEQVTEKIQTLILNGVLESDSKLHQCVHWRWNFRLIPIRFRGHIVSWREKDLFIP